MAEKVISPGVFTNELDQSFLPAAIGEIGAAIVGPTAKGPAMIPTVVSSFSEYEQIFGTTVKSGSNYYSYLTSVAAQNYLKHASKLTVVRVLDGTFSPASASISRTGEVTTQGTASLMMQAVNNLEGSKIGIGGVNFQFVSASGADAAALQSYVNKNYESTVDTVFVASSSTAALSLTGLTNVINASSSIHGLDTVATYGSNTMSLESGSYSLASSSAGNEGYSGIPFWWGTSGISGWKDATNSEVGSNSATSMHGEEVGAGTTTFELYTLSDGFVQNSVTGSRTEGTNSVLPSGSKDNIRYEISNVNYEKGTVSLLIRRGDDTVKRKQVLETWNNLSLDPMAPNYIEKIIGSQELSFQTTYIQPIGDYPQKSKYVRVKNVAQTPDYLDENGDVTYSNSASLFPAVGSGSVGGGFEGGNDGNAGPNVRDAKWYSDIDSSAGTNVQGFNISDITNEFGGTAYSEALGLLSNADEYDINMLMIPGVTNDNGSAIINKAIETCEDRGDCFVIADPVAYGQAQSTAIDQAKSYDSNYAAMYWPWVQVQDNQLGRNVWVPPSVVLGGIYAFNDKVAHPWFAPAGLNRGGIDTAIQAERKLTHANRDDMYEANLNPIATFPGQGVTVFGQKTLQKKSSALDRVNVRRLLIKVKKFIAASSRFLVFEQNNPATRRRFLNIVNPYLEQVQSNSGLNAFKVVMDSTNNTPDVIDRNIMYGQIFVQPTRTAEFIVLDFTIQPTGATFPE